MRVTASVRLTSGLHAEAHHRRRAAAVRVAHPCMRDGDSCPDARGCRVLERVPLAPQDELSA